MVSPGFAGGQLLRRTVNSGTSIHCGPFSPAGEGQGGGGLTLSAPLPTPSRGGGRGSTAHYLPAGSVTHGHKNQDSMNFQVTPWSYGMFCKIRRCERI